MENWKLKKKLEQNEDEKWLWIYKNIIRPFNFFLQIINFKFIVENDYLKALGHSEKYREYGILKFHNRKLSIINEDLKSRINFFYSAWN